MITNWEDLMMPATRRQPRRLTDAELEQVFGEQQTKTKTALEYFSRNLTAAATA